MLGSIMLFASFGRWGEVLAEMIVKLILGVLRGRALSVDVLDEGIALSLVQLDVGHEGKDAGEVLEGVGCGLRVGGETGEELLVGVIGVAHGAVVLEDDLAVRRGVGCDGLQGGEVSGEGVSFRIGAGEGWHDAIVHEGKAGEHGAGSGGIPLTFLDELVDASVAVGGVAGLAFNAEDLVADGDLVVGGEGALVYPGSRVKDTVGVDVVDSEAAIARHSCGVDGVVVEIIFNHEGFANIFTDELEGVHCAESDKADDEREDQVHAARGEEREQHEDDGDGEEAPR